MSALHVGRIGGLAVAFGVGIAVLAGTGVASAEAGSDDSGSSSASGSAGSSTTSTGASGATGADKPERAPGSEAPSTEADGTDLSNASPQDTSIESVDALESDSPTETSVDSGDALESDLSQDDDTRAPADTDDSVAADYDTSTAAGTDVADAVTLYSVPVSEGAQTAEVPTAEPVADDVPPAPADPWLAWLVAAQARRELFSNPISVDPTIAWVDGVLSGELNAVNSRGNELLYELVRDPDHGGKVAFGAEGSFTFLPDLSVVNFGGAEQFSIAVRERTALVALLESVPLIGRWVVEPMVLALQQMPVVGALLQPVIGYRVVVPFDVVVDDLVPDGAPVAFTTMVTSFDGAKISTNFFPASGLQAGQTAPTVLNGPGLGDPGTIGLREDALAGLGPDLWLLRSKGYNVVTWDPRGLYASGGVSQVDSPFFEGRDVQHILNWLAQRPEVNLDAPGDPAVGMVGLSYGGGIQLATAVIDRRIDAIVPAVAWHSLVESLYPTGAYATSWASLLGLRFWERGARINSQIYPTLIFGALFGYLTEAQQALLASNGPSVLVNNITTPTLLIAGTPDTLFPLRQAVTNARILDANGVPVRLVWACGAAGHGTCLAKQSPEQEEFLTNATLNWLDRYVKGNELVPTGPRFEWYDQNGKRHSSDLLPSDPAFYGEPVVTAGAGGYLPIIPLVGGSGPGRDAAVPTFNFTTVATRARIAVDVDVAIADESVEIVGAPELTFSYSGFGSARHIFAQLVDEDTGLVLGNIVTPIPVTLDGRSRSVTIKLEQIAYHMAPGHRLTLQLVGSATNYANLTSWGGINIGDIALALPTVAAAAAASVDLSRMVAVA